MGNEKEPEATSELSAEAWLELEGDELYATMQTPESAAAIRALFSASPEELGEAAVREASRERKRRL